MSLLRICAFALLLLLCPSPQVLANPGTPSRVILPLAIPGCWETDLKQEDDQADDLFKQKKWNEARALYDAVEATSEATKRHIAKQTINCSLELKEWDDALNRAVEFSNAKKLDIWSNHFYWPRYDPELKKITSHIEHLEWSKNLLIEIRNVGQADVPESFQKRLDEETTSLNFELLRVLDPDIIRPQRYAGWDSGYERIEWWWEGVRSTGTDWRYSRYGDGVPVDRERKPIFLATPAEYTTDLTRAKKILFLLDEVQDLDKSESKQNFAKTLLHRADLARRLFGPANDPDWQNAMFYYQYANRPTFQNRKKDQLKELHELNDNESRLVAGRKLGVFELPDSESPIAIWRRIEESYPKSGMVVEALYRRALYYQNRRQFSKARALYERIMEDHGKHERADVARVHIGNINSSDVLLGRTGVYAAGGKPTLWFASRNTERIEFTAHKVDLKSYLFDREKSGHWSEIAYLGHNIFSEWNDDSEELSPFINKKKFTQWNQTVPASEFVKSQSTLAPLDEAGAYIVEARAPGSSSCSRGLVIVSDVTLVQKRMSEKVMLWVVNSRTGQALGDQQFDLVSQGSRHSWKKVTTDKDGVAYFEDENDAFVFVKTKKGDIAFVEIEGVREHDEAEPEYSEFGITDRPLYRPGDEVNFRIWTRELLGRQNQPVKAGAEVQVHVDGPSYNDRVKTFNLVTDESGSVSGSFRLNSETPLGQYRLKIQRSGMRWAGAAGQFRIEEYKKPEYEVTVVPSAETARVGQQIKAIVKAEYYTGEPVVGGSVDYRVFRSPHTVQYSPPTKWDWLYGNGFGDYSWLYPWLGDAIVKEDDSFSEHWRYYSYQKPKELVTKGKAKLNLDGSAEVVVETNGFGKSFDHELTIEAEVSDESRRSIKGSGQVVVARQPFFAFLSPDRGWYQSGDKVAVAINTQTANEIGVSVKGTLTLCKVASKKTPDGSLAFEKNAIQEFSVETDQQGHVTSEFELSDPGIYRLGFATNGEGLDSVSCETTLLCHGPNFDGTKYRFGGLEIIPDKRLYKVGDTARLLINTAQPNARLLVWDSMNNQSFLDIPSHCKVIEIPIEERHVPNFFLEATLVHDGELFHETCELHVPPIDDMLTIELTPDQQVYRPGQKGSVRVKVNDADGNPVTGSMALRGYDKSLTYIQSESNSRPKSLVAARRTEYWNEGVTATLGAQQFEISGRFLCPEFHLEDGTEPKSGGMGGAPPSGGDPASGKKTPSSRRAVSRDPSSEGYFDEGEEPEVRSNFADNAIWLPNLRLDENGTAKSEIVFPDSLTTWRVQGFLATGNRTQVGEAVCEVNTKKNLLVRLQSPRFFTEGDEVVLSANVHNYLAEEKDVSAELIVPAKIFSVPGDDSKSKMDGLGNRVLLSNSTKIKPGETHRFDWPVKVISIGEASVTVKARTDVESDAMKMAFPVFSRVITESKSQSGFFASDETGSKKLLVDFPGTVDPSTTEIQLTFSPTAAGAAFEALPFLAGYPYGCVEQTMSRFYPTVLAADTMKKMGTDPETVSKNMEVQNRKLGKRRHRASVFDSNELARMSQSGLNRLYKFQHKDGGWGWWENDDSSRYMTAYVLLGLNAAADSGVEVSQSKINSSVRYLLYPSDTPAGSRIPSSANRRSEQAFIAYSLSLERSNKVSDYRAKIRQTIEASFEERASLNSYGKALMVLALHNKKMQDEAKMLVQELVDEIRTDEASNMSWIPTEKEQWWRWYNNDVETNAWVLRAFVALEIEKPLINRMANWLVDQRKNGTHWRSTRDSALAVHALADFMLMMQKSTDDFSVAVNLDGKHVRDVSVSWKNMLAMENRVSLSGIELGPGSHEVALTKKDDGSLYFALTADYDTQYDRIPATNNGGLKVSRRYFRLNSGSSREKAIAAEKPVESKALAFGDSLSVGDTIEVELTITSSEDFEFLAFDDPKPAGCEPIRLRSGYGWGNGIAANVELRDSKVTFFVKRLRKGKHILKYKLRAEVPGTFSAMPSTGFAMYTPEINARSDEMQVQIADQP